MKTKRTRTLPKAAPARKMSGLDVESTMGLWRFHFTMGHHGTDFRTVYDEARTASADGQPKCLIVSAAEELSDLERRKLREVKNPVLYIFVEGTPCEPQGFPQRGGR